MAPATRRDPHSLGFLVLMPRANRPYGLRWMQWAGVDLRELASLQPGSGGIAWGSSKVQQGPERRRIAGRSSPSTASSSEQLVDPSGFRPAGTGPTSAAGTRRFPPARRCPHVKVAAGVCRAAVGSSSMHKTRCNSLQSRDLATG